MSLIVYTANFDGPEQYDALPKTTAEARYVAFMDINEPVRMDGWECLPARYADANPRRRARHHKAMAHELFPEAGETLWIDSNVILPDSFDVLSGYGADIISTPHHLGGPWNTWTQELERCMNDKRVMCQTTGEALNAQADKYRVVGLPYDALAPETCVLFRRHNERTAAFNAAWWAEVEAGWIRDQVSFAYARHVSGATLDLFPRSVFGPDDGKYFSWQRHIPKIYYFNPFDRRGLGWAYESCAAIVPSSECWICFMDFDVMLFPSSIGILIEDAVRQYGKEYDLFTCLTTRVLANWMCVGGKASGERDLVKLYQLAISRMQEHGSHVSPWPEPFAGYFLLFKKRLCEEIPFPKTGKADGKKCRVLGIDTAWYRRLEAAEKKIGCIDGLTAVHYYRMAEDHKDHRAMLENPNAPDVKLIADCVKTGPTIATEDKEWVVPKRRGQKPIRRGRQEGRQK